MKCIYVEMDEITMQEIEEIVEEWTLVKISEQLKSKLMHFFFFFFCE